MLESGLRNYVATFAKIVFDRRSLEQCLTDHIQHFSERVRALRSAGKLAFQPGEYDGVWQVSKSNLLKVRKNQYYYYCMDSEKLDARQKLFNMEHFVISGCALKFDRIRRNWQQKT